LNFSDLLSFNKFVSPVLIRIIYWIGLFFIAIGTLGAMFGGGMLGMGGGVSGFIFGLIGGVMMALIWRVVCEIWIVIFSINDRLGIIAEQPR